MLAKTKMKENNILALIVAYYLSRFDEIAYEKLAMSSKTAAHSEIGRRLSVKANTIKNMRDEFDSIHDNGRAGWYQRPLKPSRLKIVELFHMLSEEELREVIREILNDSRFTRQADFKNVLKLISTGAGEGIGAPVYQFFPRAVTGRKAEELFIKFHENKNLPSQGELKDTRDDGCGYDFKIVTPVNELLIEVKGLDGIKGGVSFTSKEWAVARSAGEQYYLVIVRNISIEPSFQLIKNPYKSISPKKSVLTTVQVRWNVTEAGLQGI